MPKQVDDMVKKADDLHRELYDSDQDDITEDDRTSDSIDEEDDATLTEDDGFEQKYNVLRGKYDKEVGRMSDMLSQTMAEKEALRVQLETASRSATPAPTRDDHFFGEGDPNIQSLIKDYPSLAKGIEAYAKKLVGSSLNETKAEVIQATNLNRRETYDSRLTSLVPDWQKLNEDPGFIDWLKKRDKYTGATRHQLLLDSWERFDVERSKAFFEDYVEETGGTKPTKSEEKVYGLTPDTSGGNVPAKGNAAKGYITRDQISEFYRDRAQGKFKGSDEDAAKIEAKIVRAVKEGKVR